MIGRRFFSAMTAAAPFARSIANSAPEETANLIPAHSGLIQTAVRSKSIAAIVYPKGWDDYQKQLNDFDSLEWKQNRIRSNYHDGRLHPSIDVLKSVSRINKIHMQEALMQRRHEERKSLRAVIARFFGVEDFLKKQADQIVKQSVDHPVDAQATSRY